MKSTRLSSAVAAAALGAMNASNLPNDLPFDLFGRTNFVPPRPPLPGTRFRKTCLSARHGRSRSAYKPHDGGGRFAIDRQGR